MGAETNVGERADGERDCHRRGRPKSSGRHEQQRFIGPCPRPGEATANVHAGADQLKRGVTPLEEAQMSQRLLRLSTLLTQRTDNGARIERYEEGKLNYAKVNEREPSIGVIDTDGRVTRGSVDGETMGGGGWLKMSTEKGTSEGSIPEDGGSSRTLPVLPKLSSRGWGIITVIANYIMNKFIGKDTIEAHRGGGGGEACERRARFNVQLRTSCNIRLHNM